MIDAVDLWGESAVLKAARQGRKGLVEALVKAGAPRLPYRGVTTFLRSQAGSRD